MNSYQLSQIGILIIFVGIIVLIIASFFGLKYGNEKNTKFSVVGIFGFIPFGFGNDKKMLIITLVLAIVIMIVSFLMFYRKIE